eukprot:15366746-Ditylum_brightwellii.AAC.2
MIGSNGQASNPVPLDTDKEEEIQQVTEMNDILPTDIVDRGGEPSLVEITGYRWKEGRLQMKYPLSTEETQWVDIQNAKTDHPQQAAQYIVDNYKSQSRNQDLELYWKVRRVVQAKKKKAKGPRTTVYKYVVEVPRNVQHALQLDKQNNNTLWQNAMALEIKALNEMECFDFRDSHPGRGGHLINILDNKVYLSNVKGISVKLLHVISQSAGLDVLCGDIGNAYVNAYTTEEVYAVAGPEFGPGLEGKIAVIGNAL